MRALIVVAAIAVAVLAYASDAVLGDLYPADSRHFTAEEMRAIAVARAELSRKSDTVLDAYYKITRRGGNLEVFVLFASRGPDGKPLFVPGNHCTVIVTPQWTVSRILPGA